MDADARRKLLDDNLDRVPPGARIVVLRLMVDELIQVAGDRAASALTRVVDAYRTQRAQEAKDRKVPR